MKVHFSISRLLVVLAALALGCARAAANDVVVDCSGATPGAFTSINAALAALASPGPNSVTVSGTCAENVLITNTSALSLLATSGKTATVQPPNGFALVIAFSRVSVSGIAFEGGEGIAVNVSNVNFDGITVRHSAGLGIDTLDSSVAIRNSSIQDNALVGVVADGGRLAIHSPTTIASNGGGITISFGQLLIQGGNGSPGSTQNVIRANGNGGVGISRNSSAFLVGDNLIDSNTNEGLTLSGSSSLIVEPGTVITSNTGVGVHIGSTSSAELAGQVQINGNRHGGVEVFDNGHLLIFDGVNISSNIGNGILVGLGGVFSSEGGNAVNNNTMDGVLIESMGTAQYSLTASFDNVTSNGKFSVECDNTSLVVGDLSSLTNVNCNRIQKQLGSAVHRRRRHDSERGASDIE